MAVKLSLRVLKKYQNLPSFFFNFGIFFLPVFIGIIVKLATPAGRLSGKRVCPKASSFPRAEQVCAALLSYWILSHVRLQQNVFRLVRECPVQAQTSTTSKRNLSSKTQPSVLPSDAVLRLFLVLQFVVDDSSHCQGPRISAQECDGSFCQTAQALLHVLVGHLKVGWVSIHIVQVQIQQSNACKRNIKVAPTRKVGSPCYAPWLF